MGFVASTHPFLVNNCLSQFINGNLLNSDTLTNTFDAANRLINSTNSTNSLTPIYNGIGDRVGQTVDGQTTNYALDIGGGLPEVIYTSQSEVYLHLPGVIVTQKATEVRYLLSDGLGSIRHAVDETATVVAYHEFDPYGNPVADEGDPYGYTGEWWEDAVGLLHLRARWYLPETGTFLSRDPWGGDINRPISLQGYLYAGNNPILYTDPFGLDYLPEFDLYTCDDPVVAGGYGPNGKPCVVDPNNVSTGNGPTTSSQSQMTFCSPTSPGDDSWQHRPGCPRSTPPVVNNTNSFMEGLDGYVEGIVGTVVAFGCQVGIKGVEVVYDFQSGERAHFTYSGTAEYGIFDDAVWKFDFFGETVIGPTGVDSSVFGGGFMGYAGPIWGFKQDGDIKSEYEGPFWSGGVSAGLPASKKLDIGTGISVFSGVDNEGLPNFGLWGAIVPVPAAPSKSWSGKFSLPINVSVGWTKYEILGSAYKYPRNNQQIDYTSMMRDVAAGVGSPLTESPHANGIDIRRLAVDTFIPK